MLNPGKLNGLICLGTCESRIDMNIYDRYNFAFISEVQSNIFNTNIHILFVKTILRSNSIV